jgi:ATP-dependent Lon protease
MNMLDEKIKNSFPNESLFKSPDIYRVFSGFNLPSFIKDWILKKYTDDEGGIDIDGIKTFIKQHIIAKDTKLRGALINDRSERKFLARIIIEPDIGAQQFKFSIPETDIKSNEALIPRSLVNNHEELLGGETWGVIKVRYVPPLDRKKGYIEMVDFKPFQPYIIEIEYFIEKRKHFSIEEWIDVLIRSMEYNPEGFDSLEQKITFICRLLPFVEGNLNFIELAPKGTGKSYLFSNLSKNAWLVSGGTVTRAQLFYNLNTKQPGIFHHYDLVAFDEIETICFGEEAELQGALKNYLESGSFTVGNYKGSSSAGLVLLGNIPLSESKRPISNRYFSNLPDFFKSSALLDRFHGFLEGWKLPRINENMKLKGYALNVEYFSEILHSLRLAPEYPNVINELLNIPKNADTRDTKAIIKLTSALLKLLFPHVTSPSYLSKEDFKLYCLDPAKRMRKIIKEQISMIDPEFTDTIPDIGIR